MSSALYDRCPHCNELGLRVTADARGERSCMNCFQVVEESQLDSSITYSQLEEQGYNSVQPIDDGITTSAKNARRDMKSHVKTSCAALNMGQNLITECLNYVENFFLQKMGGWKNGMEAQLWVSACIYVVCRKNKLPVSLVKASEAMNCDPFKLGQRFKQVVSRMGDGNVRPVKSEQFVPVIVDSLGLDNQKSFVEGKIRALVEFTETEWLSHGRKPEVIISACGRLVCEAYELKTTMEDICGVVSSSPRSAQERYLELKKCLYKVVKEANVIPWTDDITLKNMKHFLGDILDYLPQLVAYRKKTSVGGYDPPCFQTGQVEKDRLVALIYRAKQLIADMEKNFKPKESSNGSMTIQVGDGDGEGEGNDVVEEEEDLYDDGSGKEPVIPDEEIVTDELLMDAMNKTIRARKIRLIDGNAKLPSLLKQMQSGQLVAHTSELQHVVKQLLSGVEEDEIMSGYKGIRNSVISEDGGLIRSQKEVERLRRKFPTGFYSASEEQRILHSLRHEAEEKHRKRNRKGGEISDDDDDDDDDDEDDEDESDDDDDDDDDSDSDSEDDELRMRKKQRTE